MTDDEVTRLRRWKEEATQVITQWEEVWDRLGKPGALGEDKSLASAQAVAQLQVERATLGELVVTYEGIVERFIDGWDWDEGKGQWVGLPEPPEPLSDAERALLEGDP